MWFGIRRDRLLARPDSLLQILLLAIVLVLVAGALSQWRGARRDAVRLPPPGQLVTVGGYRLHLFRLGAGSPTVVFVSGIAASCLNWLALHRELASRTTAVATDRAGLGWSDPGPRGLTAAAHAAHLRLALRQAGLSPPFLLVAHSYGGYVAELLTAADVRDVAGLVLVDPISWREWVAPDEPSRRVLRGGAVFARVGAALAALGLVRVLVARFRAGSDGAGRAVLGSFGREAEIAVSRVMGEVGKMPREAWDAIQAHWTRPRSFIAMARHFSTLSASAREVRDAEPDAGGWNVPLVVLGSGRASEAQREGQQAIAALSSRGRYVLVEDAGHWIHLDRPDIVIGAIAELVAVARVRHPSDEA